MKQITVLSGKGGTGKTTLVASFAALAQKMVVTDCDVDAPDLHLLLNPEIQEKREFTGSKLAVINEGKCVHCDKCSELCRFDAIESYVVDSILCEGCGVCAYVCPVKAIELSERLSGYAFISKTKYGPMSHARLIPGEENSGKLVTFVRQNARQIAETDDYELILNDGSPGIGCPVIASVAGVDLGFVIIEPTLSGIHDLKRVLALLDHFKIKPLVCINKYDINIENTNKIIEFCELDNVEIAGKIPFDSLITKAMVVGKSIIEHSPKSMTSRTISDVWKQTLKILYS